MKLQRLLEEVCQENFLDVTGVLINICTYNGVDCNTIDSFDDICEQIGLNFRNCESLLEWIVANEYYD